MIKVKLLDTCSFPIVQREIGAFKVLVIPPELLMFFKEGYHAVRVYSSEAATLLPNLGGGTVPGRSQTPHQDHDPRDPRWFLAFSKSGAEPRGSATYLVHPDHIQKRLAWLLAQFEARREEVRREFIYRPPYMLSKKELYQCFDPGGLNRLAASKAGEEEPAHIRLYVYAGILTYLLQDRIGDEIVQTLLKEEGQHIWVERWDTEGLLIVDNSRTFHGRYGPNIPLRRNWLVAS